MSEPSFANGHSWDNPGRDPADLTFRTRDNGNASAAPEEDMQDDDDVTESKIRAFLDEKVG